jgi:ribose transport system ATP-binding protein
MVGRSVDQLFPSRGQAPGESVLEVKDLAAPPVVSQATFTLRRGEILGIAGLMGSGRTEMVRALFGLAPVASGTVRIAGVTAGPAETPSRRIAQRVGYLSEDRKGEGLAHADVGGRQPDDDGLLGVCQPRLVEPVAAAQRHAALDRRPRHQGGGPDLPVRTLSGGNQQKVVLGRLLFQDADVLLLDEPTRGVDIGSKAQIYEAIAQAASSGKAVLMISSYLPELFGLCDQLAVMSRGRLSPVRPIGEWTPERVLHAAIDADAGA